MAKLSSSDGRTCFLLRPALVAILCASLLTVPASLAAQGLNPPSSMNGRIPLPRVSDTPRINEGTTASVERNRDYRSERPSLESPMLDTSESIRQRRESLFAELADEFNTFDRLGNLVRKVSQLVKPSVIHIEAHKSETTGGRFESYDEAGSGVVLSLDGQLWIMTNRHVIFGAEPRGILLRASDGSQFHPTQIRADESTDVAIMRVPNLNLPAARVGDSDSVGIGDFTIAIGSPFGLSHSVTFGILSAKGRRDLSLGEQKIELQDFFQTDAAINPGNSGGPLLNLRGEVIGLNTAIASSSGGSEGIGFSIPINMAMQVAQELARYGRLRRGHLGVTLDPDFSPADGRSLRSPVAGGALVKTVEIGSAAARGNLQRGDIIVQFNGNSVDNDDHLVALVGLAPLEQPLPLIVYRDGKRYAAQVQLKDRP